MQKLLALAVIYIMLACEWQNTISIWGDNFCCAMTCQPDAGGSDCEDEDLNGRCIVKSCYCCCYLLPGGIRLNSLAESNDVVTEFISSRISNFPKDVFHPPEMGWFDLS
jgi:hypothetical protein